MDLNTDLTIKFDLRDPKQAELVFKLANYIDWHRTQPQKPSRESADSIFHADINAAVKELLGIAFLAMDDAAKKEQK